MAAQLTQPPFTFFNTTTRTASPSSSSPMATPTSADGRSASKRRLINIQAGLAELMLLNRLRARTRRDRGGDTLERAAQIIEVTSRHWFADASSVAAAEPHGLDATDVVNEAAMQLTADLANVPELAQR